MRRLVGLVAVLLAGACGCGSPLPPDVCRHALVGENANAPDEEAEAQMRACVISGWRLRDRDREKYDCYATCVTKAGYDATATCADECRVGGLE